MLEQKHNHAGNDIRSRSILTDIVNECVNLILFLSKVPRFWDDNHRQAKAKAKTYTQEHGEKSRFRSIDDDSFEYCTYRTPVDDGLFGQAKNRIAGKYRDNPAFHDMLIFNRYCARLFLRCRILLLLLSIDSESSCCCPSTCGREAKKNPKTTASPIDLQSPSP